MRLEREQFLQRLLTSYADSYDVVRAQDGQPSVLAATAHFHVQEAQYILSRRATMWETESDEYVWFFSMPHLEEDACDQWIRHAYEEGMAKIDLGKQRHHMVTRLTVIFVADSVTASAEKRIRQCRLYHSFQWSLRGWMEFHAVAVDLERESVVSNTYGRETARFLRTLLHPAPAQKGRGWLKLLHEMLH